MRRFKKYSVSFVSFIVAIGLLIAAGVDLLYISPEGKINYINKRGGVSSSDALTYQKTQMEAEKPNNYSITFYELLGEENIYTPVTDREVSTPVIAICGKDDEDILGSLLTDYDDGRCVLGYETATKIFGSTDVKGLEVICRGQSYRIAGVSDNTGDILIAEGGIVEGITYTRMKVDYCNPKERIMVKQEVESKFDAGSYMENEFIYWLAGIVFSVVVCVCIFSITVVINRRISGKKRYVMIAAAVVVCIIVAVIVIDFPSDMIPSRWSDTGFWRELMKNKADNIRTFMYAEKTEASLNYLTHTGAAFIKCMAAIIFLMLGMMVYMLKGKERN